VTHTKPIALTHNDSKDRIIATNFLNERGWNGIEEGGEFELDLVVPQYKRGADVECFKGDINSFKTDGYFRIPFRKQKYWSGEPTYIDNGGNQRINPYNDWFVDYIQFCNSNTDELLWYNYKLVKHYHKNTIEWKGLYKKNFIGNQAKFIKIPYEDGIKYIQYWKHVDNQWVKINLEN
jgi:hypothetical protein